MAGEVLENKNHKMNEIDLKVQRYKGECERYDHGPNNYKDTEP